MHPAWAVLIDPHDRGAIRPGDGGGLSDVCEEREATLRGTT